MISKRRQGKRQARFWVWFKTDMVRIKINEGQTLSCEDFRYNDEGGYHRDTDTYFYDGRDVYLEWERDGRDCDGRLTHSGERTFHYLQYVRDMAHLEADSEGRKIEAPYWQRVCDHPVYDEYAQAAGY